MSKEETSGGKAEETFGSFLRRSFGRSGRTNNDPITVSDNKLQAIYYLCGEEEVNSRCKIEILDSDNKKLIFKKITFHREKVKMLRERIEGMIEQRMPVPDSQEENITSRIQTVLDDLSNVYIAYKEDQNTIEIFSENWGDMDKAKKWLEVHLKQTRAACRPGRFGSVEEHSEMESSAEAFPTSRKSECKEIASFNVQGKLLTIKVYKSSSSDLRVDGIVNPIPEKLMHGTESSGLGAESKPRNFLRKANELFRPRPQIPVTDLTVTSGNVHNYKLAFNLVGLVSSSNTSKYLDDLLHVILRCMCAARNRGLESLAMPPLSSALDVTTPEEIAKIYTRAAKSFDSVVKGGSLREVHFVDVTDRTISAFQKELDVTWSKAYLQTELEKDTETINAYLKKTDD